MDFDLLYNSISYLICCISPSVIDNVNVVNNVNRKITYQKKNRYFIMIMQ